MDSCFILQGISSCVEILINFRWNTIPRFKVFENWLIASTPKNSLITAWFKEFNYCLEEFELKDSYLVHLQDTYGMDVYNKLVQKNPMPDYLKQHVALQKAMQIDGAVPFSGLDACSPPMGPLIFAEVSGWKAEKVAEYLLVSWPPVDYSHYNLPNQKDQVIYSQTLKKNITLSTPLPPFIKLRNHERKYMEMFIQAPHFKISTTVSSTRLGWNSDTSWLLARFPIMIWYSLFGIALENGHHVEYEKNMNSIYCIVLADCTLQEE